MLVLCTQVNMMFVMLLVVRHIFQACPVWIYTQSNITNIICGVSNVNSFVF